LTRTWTAFKTSLATASRMIQAQVSRSRKVSNKADRFSTLPWP